MMAYKNPVLLKRVFMTLFRRIFINTNIWSEVIVRVCLLIAFLITDVAEPFRRRILQQDLWRYQYPSTPSYVPDNKLWFLLTVIPLGAFISMIFLRKDLTDFGRSILGITLTIPLTGTVTNVIKLMVGRPRPDFYWRCFPDGRFTQKFTRFAEVLCTGDPNVVREGYKSFPSGHTSMSFAALGFTSLYLAGKLHVFSKLGRGESWRLCTALCPAVIALMIGISRTMDYHHHWQDVLVGSLLGSAAAYMCYRQYYPAVTDTNCHLPYMQMASDVEYGTSVLNKELPPMSPPPVSPPPGSMAPRTKYEDPTHIV